MRPAPLLITDGTTIAIAKPPDGKFKASAVAWEDGATILADQVLEIRTRNGQLHLIRREKIKEPEDSPSSCQCGRSPAIPARCSEPESWQRFKPTHDPQHDSLSEKGSGRLPGERGRISNSQGSVSGMQDILQPRPRRGRKTRPGRDSRPGPGH